MTTLAAKIIDEVVSKAETSSELWPEHFVNRSTGLRFKIQSPEIEEFINSTDPRFVLVMAPEGAGKTALGAVKTLTCLKKGMNAVVVASSLPALRRSTWAELKEWIPWQAVVPEHQRMADPAWSPYKNFEIVFRNNHGGYSKMIIGGLGLNPVFWEGINASVAWYDEARSSESSSGFTVLVGRVRLVGPNNENPQIYLTTTPTTKAHWLFDYFGPVQPDDKWAGFKEMAKTIHLSLSTDTSSVDAGYKVARGLVLTENERRMKSEGQWGESGDDKSFLDDITMWDSLYDPDIPPVRKRTDPKANFSDVLVGAIDAGVTKDHFSCVFVSRHPKNRTHLALRLLKVWKPNNKALDFNYPEQYIRSILKEYNVMTMVYDPYQLHYMATNLKTVVWMQPFSQNTKRLLSDQQLYEFIIQKKLWHMNQPEMREYMLNAGCIIDDLERTRRIVKLYNSKKIDPVVALSMATFECNRLNI